MLPARESGLWSDVRSDIAYLNAFVLERGVGDAGADWRGIARQYEDERSYLSVTLEDADTRSESESLVRIEFGVQDAQKRHAIGGLVAHWLRERGVLGALEVVLLDGRPAEVTPFVDQLQRLVDLPECVAEIAERLD